RPDISVAVLRFANLIGPSVESPLTRYLDLRVVPTVLGSDPWVRFLHEDDGAEALLRMAFSDESGHFDVAGQDAVPLSHCLRRVGGQRLPVPERGLKVLRRAAKHGRIDYASTSTARAGLSAEGSQTGSLEHALGWSPAYSSAQAFEDFADTRGRGAHRSDGPSARGGRLSPVHVLALARAGLGRCPDRVSPKSCFPAGSAHRPVLRRLVARIVETPTTAPASAAGTAIFIAVRCVRKSCTGHWRVRAKRSRSPSGLTACGSQPHDNSGRSSWQAL